MVARAKGPGLMVEPVLDLVREIVESRRFGWRGGYSFFGRARLKVPV